VSGKSGEALFILN